MDTDNILETFSMSTIPGNLTPACYKRLPDYTLALTGTSCCLSIIGAIIIFITFAAIREIRNKPRRLLIMLTVADLMTAVGNLLGTIRYYYVTEVSCEKEHGQDASREICVVQSFITTLSSMSSFLWTLAIALHIFFTVVFRSTWIGSPHVMRLYHVICWGVPASITITAAFKGYLGEDHSTGTGSWCWIRSSLPRDTQIKWMVLTGKGWEMSCYLVTASLYIILKVDVWRQRRRRRQQSSRLSEYAGLRDEDRNYMYVWLVLYVIRVWGIIRFWIAFGRYGHAHTNHHLNHLETVLLNLQGIGDSSQAFFNCILFCFMDKTIRQKVCQRQDSELRPLLRSAINESGDSTDRDADAT